MKSIFCSISTGLFFSVLMASGQGSFIYDQQSSTNEAPPFPGSGGAIQLGSPGAGQSFAPALSSIEFIRLKFNDGQPNNGIGATLYVNLRTNSITGPVIGTTALVTLPDKFLGVSDFIFSAALSLAPGTTYYFEPVVQSGDLWNIDSGEYNYPGGMAFANGLGGPGSDLWFREGIVPEPSSGLLTLVGGVVVVWLRPRARRG